MEDLLKEEDFRIVEPYNPRKYFRMFYLGAVIHFIIAFAIISVFTGNSPIILLMVFSPLFVVFGMVFLNKRIAELTIKVILTSVFFLLCIYYAFMLLILLFISIPLDEILIMTLTFVVSFLLCSAIIVPVIKMKKKKSKISY